MLQKLSPDLTIHSVGLDAGVGDGVDSAGGVAGGGVAGGAVVVVTGDGEVIGSSRFEEPDEAGDKILIDHTFLARPYWTLEDYLAVKSLLFDHAFATFGTVELRVGVDNTRTRHAVEDFLGAIYSETVSTPLGEHAVYLISRDAWAERA